MEKFKKISSNRAITLVALIITIIVMLILVGVSIQVVINSDLIGTAQNAGNRTETAYEEESTMGEIIIEDKNYANIEDYLAGKENIGQVSAGERASIKSIYNDGTNTAIIPAGFTVSGVGTEKTINNGLVIYLIPEGTTVDWTNGEAVANAQKTYDQFVWIPIAKENINEMYMCQSEDGTKSCKITLQKVEGKNVAYCTTHSSTLMAGRLYSTKVGEYWDANLTTQTYQPNKGICEPALVTENDLGEISKDANPTNLNVLNTILGTNYTTSDNFMNDLQIEYNEIVKSVYLNEGFYVGRYETSNITTNDGTAIKVVAGTTSGINNLDWYYMYAQQKEYAINKGLSKSIGSAMIQGAAYDQVMKFVDTDSYDIATPGNVSHDLGEGNYYQTGGLNYNGTITYNDVSKNIYDLEGNMRVWTTEISSVTWYKVFRGGIFNGNNRSASLRSSDQPNETRDSIGALSQLYIK